MDMLGPLQLKIMNYLWDAPSPQTSQDIVDFLNDKGARHVTSTITTVLHSLERKNFLYRDKKSHAFTYEAIDGGRLSYRRAILSRVISDVFDADVQSLYDTVLELTKIPKPKEQLKCLPSTQA